MVATALVTLKDWAKHNKIPYRTALEWAKTKRIHAHLTEQIVQVTQEKRVRKYMISPMAMRPIIGVKTEHNSKKEQ